MLSLLPLLVLLEPPTAGPSGGMEAQADTVVGEGEAEPLPAAKFVPEPVTAEPMPVPSQAEMAAETGHGDSRGTSSPWFRDGLGWGLLGTGVAVTAAGAGLLVQAQGDQTSADRALERVRALRVVGGSLTGVGVALLAGAGVRYGLVARRTRRATAISWSPVQRGVVIRTTIRF